MIEHNLDPEIEEAVASALSAAADLATARIQLDNLELGDILTPLVVDAAFLQQLANAQDASREMQDCARQVSNGRHWEEIEQWARPMPPELVAIRGSASFEWTFPPCAEQSVHMPDSPGHGYSASDPSTARSESFRPSPGVVGPSDWPDDEDEYPEEVNWFE